MIFNSGVSKHPQEFVFCQKAITTNHATVYFNYNPVIRENLQRQLGLFIDCKVNFSGHINEKMKKQLKVSTSPEGTCHYHSLPFWQYINHLSGHI